MNIIILQGRPTHDPVMKDTKAGTQMCKMRLAVDRTRKDKYAPKKTDFFDVLTFGKIGENVYKNLGKGAFCTVLGRIEQKEYEDRTGNRREGYTVIANKVSIHEWTKKRPSVLEEIEAADEDLLIPREITKSLYKHIDLEDEDIPDDLI